MRTLATTEFHIATSRCLLEQAEREYRAGDVLQASEKGWGAAAHAVKAIAEGRGWEHDRHGHLFRTARRIANEWGSPRYGTCFTWRAPAPEFLRGLLTTRMSKKAWQGCGSCWACWKTCHPRLAASTGSI